ncbi:(-)-germacrene D synthase-like isoform X1 [Amaranthus tricolor]|uniref:(-)-germacrene D synthase-like isoform X1 n=1 Tax=Amaranthus tricolor TaxID=29722 RepID=UPI00258BCD10|nr:(-)-germacrene D synthase-like isoform X1 [Amaranthus tricolor]
MEEQNNFCSSNHNETQNNGRPLAHFHPDLWGDHFLNYTPPDEAIQTQREQEVRELKEEVRRKLLGIAKDYKERLILIDVVEQLGIAYHFEDEIEANLQHIYNYSKPNDQHEDDLHFVSLRFRLLRQHGFFASSDVFNKFKNEDGKFEESLTKDVLGILNLYEAANLRIHGEKILDEAVEFTTTRLKSLVGQLKNPLKAKVSRALKLPLQKGVIRLLSRYYISTYEDESAHDETILKFAKLDFNLLQTLHLKELRDLSRWWKDLDFGRKLPFARNRITEVYFWILGTFYEPKYTLGREIFTKLFKMTSIMDDTYDAYGLFPELVAYTEAVHRWDEKCTDQLPDYMKLTYEALLHTFADFERKLAKEGRSELVSYVRELMKAQCQGYFQEAKWCHEKYIPTYDEYLNDAAIITAGYTLMSGTAFLGMAEFATKSVFEWVSQTPKPIKASCIIGRLIGDMASFKIERKRDHVASVVECYKKQYGVNEEEAIKELQIIVEKAWMDLNEEMLRPTTFPMPLMTRILNLSRVIEVFYRLGEDDYSFVSKSMQDKIRLVLIDPIHV